MSALALRLPNRYFAQHVDADKEPLITTHQHPDLLGSLTRHRSGIETELYLDIRRRCIGLSVSILALVSLLLVLCLY